MEIFAARMNGEQVTKISDPTVAEMRKRNQLDDQYIRLLQGLLTAEQFLELPGADRWLNKSRVAREKAKQAKGEGKEE